MNVTLNVPNNMQAGVYDVKLFSIVLNTVGNVAISPADVTAKLTAFRAYFEFRDVLDAYYDVAEARITFSLDGNTLGTTLVNSVEVKSDGVKSEVYNLNGQRVSKAGKGVYIVNGKKVVKK